MKFFSSFFRPKTDPLPPPLSLVDVLKTVHQTQKSLSVAAYQLADLLEQGSLNRTQVAALTAWHEKSEFALSQLQNSAKDALEAQRLAALNTPDRSQTSE